jgi:hypothetical protein
MFFARPEKPFFWYAAFAPGIIFSIVAVGSGAYFLNFRSHSLVTTGTVISVDHRGSDDCPTVRFQAADKQFYSVACRVWQNEYFSVGQVVPVRYRQSDPNNAWRESQVRNIPRFTALSGVFAICLSYVLRRFARRRESV